MDLNISHNEISVSEGNLYKLPKDILVKLISTIQNDIRKEQKYYIIEIIDPTIYRVKIIDTENEVRTYLYNLVESINNYYALEKLNENIKLEDLIIKAKGTGSIACIFRGYQL